MLILGFLFFGMNLSWGLDCRFGLGEFGGVWGKRGVGWVGCEGL